MSSNKPNPFAAPYEIRHGPRYHKCGELERHEILHCLRGHLESSHRVRLVYGQIRRPYEPSIEHLPNLPPFKDSGHAIPPASFWNKSFPVYNIGGDKVMRHLLEILLVVLHRYLYRRWFRPYRSNIEHDQFIAKVMTIHGQADTHDDALLVRLATSMNKAVCARVDETWHAADEAARDPSPETSTCVEALGFMGMGRLGHLKYYSLRPLFRAVIIVIRGRDYGNCKRISKIEQMPVMVILTGHTAGLSAPISFDQMADKADVVEYEDGQAASTTLETAVNFMMALEAREEAAFGEQPDPVASTAYPDGPDLYNEMWFPAYAREMGWGGWDEHPVFTGPSSRWVSLVKYPNWTGHGAGTDGRMMELMERGAYRMHLNWGCTCEQESQADDQDGHDGTDRAPASEPVAGETGKAAEDQAIQPLV